MVTISRSLFPELQPVFVYPWKTPPLANHTQTTQQSNKTQGNGGIKRLHLCYSRKTQVPSSPYQVSREQSNQANSIVRRLPIHQKPFLTSESSFANLPSINSLQCVNPTAIREKSFSPSTRHCSLTVLQIVRSWAFQGDEV